MSNGLCVLTYPHFFIHKLRDLFTICSFNCFPVVNNFLIGEVTRISINFESFKSVEIYVKACVSFERSVKDVVCLVLGPELRSAAIGR